jgi:NarL family two-component system response regulator LiaR
VAEQSLSRSGSEGRIRVLTVDDHALIRNALRYVVLASDDLELVGEATNGEEAVALCAQVKPDVVLMDLMMPGVNGATATRAICERWPHIRVIALTNYQAVDLVRGALDAGATGYLLKNVSAEELANAIRAAHTGQPTLSPEATEALIQTETHPPGLGSDLTPRESEVLTLMVQGLSNTAIAERLVIGLSSVRFHVSNIVSKLGVTGRAEAAALALQNDLVQLPGQNATFD